MPFIGGVGFGGGGLKKANFTNTATGTYNSGGKSYKYVRFTGNNTLTIDEEGVADVLIVGGGSSGGGEYAANGAGGGVVSTTLYIAVGSYSVVVGSGACCGGATATGNGGRVGNPSRIGSISSGQSTSYSSSGVNAPFTSSITGSSITYAPTANISVFGGGGVRAGCCYAPPGQNGANGVVIVRVEL